MGGLSTVWLATLTDENSVLDGAARWSLQSTAGVNPIYLRKLEKGASYPGLEITRRHARHGRAAAQNGQAPTSDKMLNKDFRDV
jgi:hypothetical protein